MIAIKKRKKGVTVIEMVVGLIVLLPIMLVLADFVLMNIAQQINDNAAREAVRVAAAGDPQQANLRANEVINRLTKSAGGYASNLQLVSLNFNPANLLANEAQMGQYGGLLQGSVTVNTKLTVTPIAISFYTNGPVTFQAQQTCPITYTVPNTTGSQPINP